MRGKPHSDETRAAVMAALMAGQSVSDVVAQYRLPENTIREWAKGLGAQLVEVRAQKERNFGTLTANYLEELLVTLAVQARVFRNETWLQKQPAAEVAVLHGVMADKGFRLLEAAARADEAHRAAAPDDTGALPDTAAD